MIFRLYHDTRGGHVHCRLFSGRNDGALGKCGDFVMRVEEFALFIRRAALASHAVKLERRLKRHLDWPARYRRSIARQMERQGYAWAEPPPLYLVEREVLSSEP